MQDVTVTLPYGEKMKMSEIFENPQNWYGIDDPAVMEEMEPVNILYNEIRSFWTEYNNRHGRHIYGLAECIQGQIALPG